MRRALAITAIVAALAAGAGGTLAVTALASGGYDEAAHRAEVERVLGLPIPDWREYLAAAADICELDDVAFAHVVELAGGDGQLSAMRVNVRHLCPDREGLLP